MLRPSKVIESIVQKFIDTKFANNTIGVHIRLGDKVGDHDKKMFTIQKYYKYTTCLPSYIVHNAYITENNKTCDVDTFILHLYISSSEMRSKCFKRYEL